MGKKKRGGIERKKLWGIEKKQWRIERKKLWGLAASLLCLSLFTACGGGRASTRDDAAAEGDIPTVGDGIAAAEGGIPTVGDGIAAAEGTTDSGAAPSHDAALKLTTGDHQGTYFSFGSVLAGQVTNTTSTAVTAIPSGGSQANLQSLADNTAQLGFVQSDVLAYSYNGTRLFDAPETGVSVVAALYREQVQIVTLNPDIKSVADLKGRTVSVGDVGSGVNVNAVDILSVYGIDVKRDINPVYESFSASAESLLDNRIDAAFMVAGAPVPAVSALAAAGSVYLVGLDDAHIAHLQELFPSYARAVVTADTYHLPQDVPTVAVDAVVIARNDTAAEDVYHFVSAVLDGRDQIIASHAMGGELDLEYAASVTSVPYHPGAARYFNEKGLTVPVT